MYGRGKKKEEANRRKRKTCRRKGQQKAKGKYGRSEKKGISVESIQRTVQHRHSQPHCFSRFLPIPAFLFFLVSLLVLLLLLLHIHLFCPLCHCEVCYCFFLFVFLCVVVCMFVNKQTIYTDLLNVMKMHPGVTQ